MNFDFKHIMIQAWPILSILILCSVTCLAVALQSWSLLGRCRWMIRDTTSRPSLIANLATVEARLALLGSIANATPFIGLLGTVIGIIRAFRSISMNTGGGLSSVAGGISEALISTAAGLAVAIPASMLYNYLTYHHGRVSRDAGLE